MVGMRNSFIVAVCSLALGILAGCGKDNGSDGASAGSISNAPGSSEKTGDGYCSDSLEASMRSLNTRIMEFAKDGANAAASGDIESAKNIMTRAAEACTGATNKFQSGFECTARSSNKIFRINDLKAACEEIRSQVNKM